MKRALVLSQNEKVTEFLKRFLIQNKVTDVVCLSSCAKARRLLLVSSFDICFLTPPLSDEFGDIMAKDIAYSGICQVILIVKDEISQEISSRVEDYGVLTLTRPINKTLFFNTYKLCEANYNRLTRMQRKTDELQSKIDDIKRVDLAKCLLIEKEQLTEAEAHKTIEKEAMNMRITRREVAEIIIKKYK